MTWDDGTVNATAHWPGYFISFEGIDGVGKSTHVGLLREALQQQGLRPVTVTPHETAVGAWMWDYVLHHTQTEIDPWVEALLFNAARAELLHERIMPALKDGAVVIADRFADSTIAFQGGGRGLPVDKLRALHHDACHDIWPDLTILLTLPRDVAAGRQSTTRESLDRIETASEAFHQAVARQFHTIAAEEPGRVLPIDADRETDVVAESVREAVLARLPERLRPVSR